MKTVKIRELRAPTLVAEASAGELVGLMNDRAFIAVLIPMGQAWVKHLVDQNWSRVMQSVATAEAELASGAELDTLEDVLDHADRADDDSAGVAESRPFFESPSGQVTSSGASSSPAAAAPVEGPAAELQHLTDALSAPGERPITSSKTIKFRELASQRIDQAREDGELLVLTIDGALIGIVVPVSQQYVEHVVTENISRVMHNIRRAEEAELSGEGNDTLDDTLKEAEAASAPAPGSSSMIRRRRART